MAAGGSLSFFVGTFLSPPLLTALTGLAGSLLGAVAGVGAACLALAGVVFALRGRQPGPAPIR